MKRGTRPVGFPAYVFTSILAACACAGLGQDAGAAPAPKVSPAIEPAELMNPVEAARKRAICGPNSLNHDSVNDYSRIPTDFFPGRAAVLADPHEAALAKLALIETARHTVDLSTFIFNPGLTSDLYVNALMHALQRGVDVRILVDAGGSFQFALKDRYNRIRALRYAAESYAAQYRKDLTYNRAHGLPEPIRPGTADVVIFRPFARLLTGLSTLKDRLWDHADVRGATASNWDRRSHDKILLIDRDDPAATMAIVGGRNIDDAYYAVPRFDESTFEDMEVMLADDPSGGALRLGNTLGSHFQNLFCAKGNRWLQRGTLGANAEDWLTQHGVALPVEDSRRYLHGALGRFVSQTGLMDLYRKIWGSANRPEAARQYFADALRPAGLAPVNEIQNVKRRFDHVLVDPNLPFTDSSDDNADSIFRKFRQYAAQSTHSIDICTPYLFVPPDEQDCLKAWVMAAPDRHIRIVSASVATTDSAGTMATFDFESAPGLLREGHYRCEYGGGPVLEGDFRNADAQGQPRIRIYELGGLDDPRFRGNRIDGHPATATGSYGQLHAKFAMFDGGISFVGSDNFDQRSRHLNSETGVFVESAEIAAALTQSFDGLVARSVGFGSHEWQVLRGQPQVAKRLQLMETLERVFRFLPQASVTD